MGKIDTEKATIMFEELFFLTHLRKKYTKVQFEEELKALDIGDRIDLFHCFCKGEKLAAKKWNKMMKEIKEEQKAKTKRINSIKMDIERTCRVCGCTNDNCCIDKTNGEHCHWVEYDLCNQCQEKI